MCVCVHEDMFHFLSNLISLKIASRTIRWNVKVAACVAKPTCVCKERKEESERTRCHFLRLSFHLLLHFGNGNGRDEVEFPGLVLYLSQSQFSLRWKCTREGGRGELVVRSAPRFGRSQKVCVCWSRARLTEAFTQSYQRENDIDMEN